MQKFDDTLLSDYMDSFLGYGATNADYWFVGMEEGGGNSFEEVNRRLTQWDERGRNALEDIYDYHLDIGVSKWFQKKAPLQPTWNRLIRVLLAAKGVAPERELVRSYQIEQLGRSNGEVCLLEFLPLPSPTTNHWLYDKHSDIPVLASRKLYVQQIGMDRVKTIAQRMLEYQPKFVMFYGIGYLDWWQKVANTVLNPTLVHDKTAYFGKSGDTAIAVSQHPVAQGVSLEYFHEIGRTLSEIRDSIRNK